jgi:hypothetical protein
MGNDLENDREDDERARLEIRHLAFGWWTVFSFVLLGLFLEGLHAFKADYLVNVENETRRSMWTLAHAHGALLGLMNVGMSYAVGRLRDWLPRSRMLASGCLLAGTVMIPGGFFLGGLRVYSGDPGPGIFLVPPGGLLLLYAVFLLARATGGRAGPTSGLRSRDRSGHWTTLMQPWAFSSLVLGTLLYRAAVVATAAPEIMPLTLLMTGVGFVFLVAAVVVWRRRPFVDNGLAVLFLLASALHWGGYLAPEPLQEPLIVSYLLVSSVFAHWVLLLFALRERGTVLGRRWQLGIAALPAACLLSGAIAMLETDVLQTFSFLQSLQSDLYVLASLVVLLTAKTRPGRFAAYGTAGAYAVYLAVALIDASVGIEIGPYGAEPLNAVYVAIALGFAAAGFAGKRA